MKLDIFFKNNNGKYVYGGIAFQRKDTIELKLNAIPLNKKIILVNFKDLFDIGSDSIKNK